eukprot:TRINITY_DN12475_c0_g1_i1.p2 TRINITY_DN12475_c0_g1~~TRINITY_DN12475_c0_g1_i1.p2  ORF type:complete len:348 (+),score=26.80 TRINITY_DN12475_c0_g1_i1:153-1196(+)
MGCALERVLWLLTVRLLCQAMAACTSNDDCGLQGSCNATTGHCICDTDYTGIACQTAVCVKHDGRVPGLYIRLYQGYNFDTYTTQTQWPNIDYTWSQGPFEFGQSTSLPFSAVAAGYVTSLDTGFVRFECSSRNISCRLWVNQILVDNDAAIQVRFGEAIRIKLELQANVSTAITVALKWTSPQATSQQAMLANASTIAAESLTHQVVCPSGCDHGCCQADGVCACDLDFGGVRCHVKLSSCGGGPSAKYKSSAVTAKLYNGDIQASSPAFSANIWSQFAYVEQTSYLGLIGVNADNYGGVFSARLLPQSQMIYTLKKCVPFLSISSGTGRTSVFEARIVDIFLAEM